MQHFLISIQDQVIFDAAADCRIAPGGNDGKLLRFGSSNFKLEVQGQSRSVESRPDVGGCRGKADVEWAHVASGFKVAKFQRFKKAMYETLKPWNFETRS